MKDKLSNMIQSAVGGCAKNWADIIADYLINSGVIVPPLKVGDKIYALSASKTKLYVLTITHFVVNENETQIWAVGAPYASGSDYICNADDFGNNEWVFLTRELAEEALQGGKNG
ncbi:MAG: hypothetical protein IKL79_01185 [Clostridia bacterium]|nr:hypothetical protein [Clostridia bacterium]